MDIAPIYLSGQQVMKLLTWVMINEAVEEAMKSIVHKAVNDYDEPFAHQPQRSVTTSGSYNKILLTMPGFVGNYNLTESYNEAKEKKIHNTLACKMVTSFRGNDQLAKPLPNILANILLFSTETGQLQCIMDGTQITAWRTAAASIIATKYLYFARFPEQTARPIKVAIIGCGVQGQSHAIGMCATYNVTHIYLWNRTYSKAEKLAEILRAKAPNTTVIVVMEAAKAVEQADVICVGTYSPTALISLEMLKKRSIHINTVGAGEVHYGEVAQNIYDNATVYVDSWENARVELEGLKANIVAEVGEVIKTKNYPRIDGISIFQSMGMAVEDATVAQAVFTAYQNNYY